MRISLCLGLLLLPGSALAQGRPDPPPDSVSRTVRAIEQRIGEANFACDYRYFADIEAPEFIFTDGAGGVTTRAQDLAGESTCTPKRGVYALEDILIHQYGDVVVFNALATTTATNPKGEPVTRKHRFTDVLVRRDGRWLLVAGHASRVP